MGCLFSRRKEENGGAPRAYTTEVSPLPAADMPSRPPPFLPTQAPIPPSGQAYMEPAYRPSPPAPDQRNTMELYPVMGSGDAAMPNRSGQGPVEHQYLPQSRHSFEQASVKIPLELQSWFFGKIDVERCVKILGDPKVHFGTFLIRDSTSTQDASVLSLKAMTARGPEICSIRINQALDRTGQLRYHSGHDGREFSSMEELIEHYQKNGIRAGDRRLPVGQGVTNTGQNNDFNRSGDRFEIMDSHITDTGVSLGEGQFGIVNKGILKKPNGTEIAVALKKLKSVNKQQIEEFQKEVDVLKMVYHDNIVTFYGVCNKEGKDVIVTEFMSKGDLLHHLKKNQTLALCDLVYYALKIASGMKFLESQNLVHRDLAARNVLLGEHYLVKINDFGMSRLTSDHDGIYESKAVGAMLPVKWTAPEGTHRMFTSKSDVWSYGILLTEIVTCGAEPYKGIPNQGLAERIEHQGLRMTKAELGPKCSDEIYKLMEDCWETDPQWRPNFTVIYTRMTAIFQPLSQLLYG